MVGHIRAAASAVIAAILFVLFASGGALAQGNVGGTIGKKNKTISGDRPTRAAPQQRPARAARQRPARAVKHVRSSAPRTITGKWRWTADCVEDHKHYDGILTFDQTGNTFTAHHGATNIFDLGTITDGRVTGNRVSFTRQWGPYIDHVALVIAGSRMHGVIPNTKYAGRCVVNFARQ